MKQTLEEIRKRYPWTASRGSSRDISALAPALRGLFRRRGAVAVFYSNTALESRFSSPQDYQFFFDWVKKHFPGREFLCPAHLAYNPEPEQCYTAFSSLFDTAPETNLVAIPPLGFFSLARGRKAAALRQEYCLDLLRIYLQVQAEGDFNPGEFRRVLDEHYTPAFSAATLPAGSLAGKIAVVTGGAQGFGKGMAAQLLSWGASLVLADLNGPLVTQTARELEGESAEAGQVLALKVDVGSEADVRCLAEDVAAHFGGVDILLSNAGVLRAGSLDTLDLAAFKLSTRVNYTAFFLCCKHLSRLMKIQSRFQPGFSADIIQINSKSGLAGSKRNFAYAGSKFGGLGLTQSFALELVEYGIKVNAVCPGNFFEGPLWSDPDNGLFVQYLKAGKVPGAGTIADVRRFYESKVPMGRGCRVADVARAVLYIIEQEYETGQAVPVTGGQIMLK